MAMGRPRPLPTTILTRSDGKVFLVVEQSSNHTIDLISVWTACHTRGNSTEMTPDMYLAATMPLVHTVVNQIVRQGRRTVMHQVCTCMKRVRGLMRHISQASKLVCGAPHPRQRKAPKYCIPCSTNSYRKTMRCCAWRASVARCRSVYGAALPFFIRSRRTSPFLICGREPDRRHHPLSDTGVRADGNRRKL